MSIPIPLNLYQHLLFDFCCCCCSHPSVCEVVFYCGFDLNFSDKKISSIFSCAYWSFAYIPWEKNLFRHFTYFLKCVILSSLTSNSTFYILETKSLYDIWFLSLFFHSIGSFHFLEGVI